MVGRSQSCAKRWPGLCLAVCLGLAVVARPSPAVAQELPGRLQSDAGGLLRLLIESATQAGSKAGGQVFSVVNQIQLYDIEGEIDRLVGSPWQLSDSTTYKLELAPQHVAFPVYDQLVRQMTRLDDIRTSRIQNLTVDAVPLIAVDLDALRTFHMVVVDDNMLVDNRLGINSYFHSGGYFERVLRDFRIRRVHAGPRTVLSPDPGRMGPRASTISPTTKARWPLPLPG